MVRADRPIAKTQPSTSSPATAGPTWLAITIDLRCGGDDSPPAKLVRSPLLRHLGIPASVLDVASPTPSHDRERQHGRLTSPYHYITLRPCGPRSHWTTTSTRRQCISRAPPGSVWARYCRHSLVVRSTPRAQDRANRSDDSRYSTSRQMHQ